MILAVVETQEHPRITSAATSTLIDDLVIAVDSLREINASLEICEFNKFCPMFLKQNHGWTAAVALMALNNISNAFTTEVDVANEECIRNGARPLLELIILQKSRPKRFWKVRGLCFRDVQTKKLVRPLLLDLTPENGTDCKCSSDPVGKDRT